MDTNSRRDGAPARAGHDGCCCGGGPQGQLPGLTRRGFLGGAVALGGAALLSPGAAAKQAAPAGQGASPTAVPLRVQPALLYQVYQRREKTSWRGYGGLHTRRDVDEELARITAELKKLAAEAEFPLDVLPPTLVGNDAEAAAVAEGKCDALLVFASGGPQHWLEKLAASKKPNVLFVRHRSGPIYLWYEIAHWRFLRKSEDDFQEPNMGVEDVVVDDYAEVLWRLRALGGLKNARGTKVAAIGGLQAYSGPGGECGPAHARDVWGFDVKSVATEEVARRIAEARADRGVMQESERRADELLAQPNVTLRTDRRFVVNTFLAWKVFRQIMDQTGATNVGVANCMGSLIGLLDTPPCLVLSLLNDEGFTAFCHVDFTHTPAGVLLRWISGKPSFVCNSHFPHHGMVTLAHCAAPRKMNGKDCEPVQIVTHFESDYGAATKVQYTKGQVATCIIPNLHCTKWLGFRGTILDAPSYDVCRSQIDMKIEGDWRRLLTDMQGFHTIVCYGDYLREVGYVLGKLGIAWENVSGESGAA